MRKVKEHLTLADRLDIAKVTQQHPDVQKPNPRSVCRCLKTGTGEGEGEKERKKTSKSILKAPSA